jgi:hypothetical protein
LKGLNDHKFKKYFYRCGSIRGGAYRRGICVGAGDNKLFRQIWKIEHFRDNHRGGTFRIIRGGNSRRVRRM